MFAHLQPEAFSLMLGVNLIVMVILGGSGTVLGPVIGTTVIVYLQTAPKVADLVRWENDTISDRWYLSAQGLIALLMIVVLFAMPSGIVGTLGALSRRFIRPRSTMEVGRRHEGDPAEHLYGEAAGTTELVVSDVGLSFGGVRAVESVSLSAEAGQVVALIGPNGAGKSSVVNLISGVYASRSGTISLAGTTLNGVPAHRRARLGLARTFQTPIISPDLTVEENVAIGSRRTATEMLGRAVVTTPASRRQRRSERADIDAVLALVGLSEVALRRGDELSYGQQRLLEMARALVSRPKVLVLDEPAAGLNPSEIGELVILLRRLRERGVATVIVEHHMELVREIADHVVCMIDGRVACEGDADTVLADPGVIGAYLGGTPAANVEEASRA